uniref:Uncharacterized protein n=1 Tax=uncultured bacterium contig00055 TaxID=1181539 RepID=A0A806K1L9_9BACT|nr:hypothetical protein [uncultured bacterium contig00055]
MKSLALQPQGNKFIREKGRIRFTQSDLEFKAQRVRSVISIFLGEYFLNQSLGIPYINQTDTKTGHRAMLETSLRIKIVAVEGIKKLLHFISVYDPGKRTLDIDFAAETDRGETLEMKDRWITPTPGGSE